MAGSRESHRRSNILPLGQKKSMYLRIPNYQFYSALHCGQWQVRSILRSTREIGSHGRASRRSFGAACMSFRRGLPFPSPLKIYLSGLRTHLPRHGFHPPGAGWSILEGHERYSGTRHWSQGGACGRTEDNYNKHMKNPERLSREREVDKAAGALTLCSGGNWTMDVCIDVTWARGNY